MNVICVCGCTCYTADALLKTGSYDHAVHVCEENSKKVQEKFTEKMKQNNVYDFLFRIIFSID